MIDKKVIGITGSAGFIGSRLVRRLRTEKAGIVELDLQNGVDVTKWRAVKDIRGIDVLVHLAAHVSVADSFREPRKFLNANVNGTLNMLEVCRRCNARMIYASSSQVYGVPSYLPVDERHPVEGLNPYAISKLLGEEMCKGYYRTFGLKTTIARAFNVYGPFQSSDSLISSIARQAGTGRIVLKDPSPKRDYVFVDDVVDAYARLCEYGTSDFEIFNIGMGKSYSVQEVVDTTIEVIDNSIEVEFTNERRSNEIDEIRADISQAKTLMGWEPRISLKTGIDMVLNSLK